MGIEATAGEGLPFFGRGLGCGPMGIEATAGDALPCFRFL
jgi:hypothetical protein